MLKPTTVKTAGRQSPLFSPPWNSPHREYINTDLCEEAYLWEINVFWGVHMRANVFFSPGRQQIFINLIILLFMLFYQSLQTTWSFSDLLCMFADFQTAGPKGQEGGREQLPALCWFTANARACLTVTFDLRWHWQLKGFRRQPRLAASASSLLSAARGNHLTSRARQMILICPLQLR